MHGPRKGEEASKKSFFEKGVAFVSIPEFLPGGKRDSMPLPGREGDGKLFAENRNWGVVKTKKKKANRRSGKEKRTHHRYLSPLKRSPLILLGGQPWRTLS